MSQTQVLNCFHCGIPCIEKIIYNKKSFCCQGCKNAYTILNSHSLEYYYTLESNPGIRPFEFKNYNNSNVKATTNNTETFLFLDNPNIANDLVIKTNGNSQITLKLPSIHCTSCVWLLENLHRINPGVLRVRVNFPKREAKIVFDDNTITLRSLVELLSSIGYTPELNLHSTETGQPPTPVSIRLIIQIAVAGFGFGNIMLFSLPEYLGLSWTTEIEFVHFFGYFNFLLILPIVFFSGWDYFTSAWIGIKHRFISIDVPISLGITVLFLRSTYEVMSGAGSGYFDSLAGLVFFLLLGRAFQEYTYHYLSFENDYRSYFPIAIHKRVGNTELAFPIKEIIPGDELIIFPGQIIPVDAKLLDQNAEIDFSFITGEANWTLKRPGEKVMAGGRNGNKKIVVVAINKFSQSSFMEVWNHEIFSTTKNASITTSGYQSILIKRVSKSFTLAIIGLATAGALYWWIVMAEPTKAIEVFTAVLIIACPCALAISSPITLGVGLRILQQNGLFVKNTESLEKAAHLDTIVLDKTGTLTTPVKEVEKIVEYNGTELSTSQIKALYILTKYSFHPLSITLNSYLKKIYPSLQSGLDVSIKVNEFKEHPGKGVAAVCGGIYICYGSSDFIGSSLKNNQMPLAGNTNQNNNHKNHFSQVHITVDNRYCGVFTIRQAYRVDLKSILASLRSRYHLVLLTGDNPGEEKTLQTYFKPHETLKFYQSPMDKLKWIQAHQQQGKRVLMLGDGLNDAGALKQSDVGVALTEDIRGFSPACDAILSAPAFTHIPKLLNLSRITHKVITLCLIVSFTYNSVGLFFALSGKLSPLIAAILMPLSSASVVLLILILMYFWSIKNSLKFI